MSKYLHHRWKGAERIDLQIVANDTCICKLSLDGRARTYQSTAWIWAFAGYPSFTCSWYRHQFQVELLEKMISLQGIGPRIPTLLLWSSVARVDDGEFVYGVVRLQE